MFNKKKKKKKTCCKNETHRFHISPIRETGLSFTPLDDLDLVLNGYIDSNHSPAISEHNAGVF